MPRGKRIKTPPTQKEPNNGPPPIYLVSGAAGHSGSQVVETVLAQFTKIHVPVIKATHVRTKKQITDVIAKASKTGGTVVHTLVDPELRKALVLQGEKKKVATIDLMGDLIDHMAEVLGSKPAGKPGLYRKLHKDYFNRVSAIEYTINHDDGQRVRDLASADIVLTGISRSGKTPLSMYLAVHGWKTANIPLVPQVPPPDELFTVDKRRVFGLSIAYEDLMMHRREREKGMGTAGTFKYTDRSAVLEEMEAARKVFKKGGFHVVNVTDKPIESIAEEIIEHLIMSLKKKPAKQK